MEWHAKARAEQLGDGGCLISQGLLVAPEHSTPRAVAVRGAPGSVAAPGPRPRVARALDFLDLREVEQEGRRECLALPAPLLVLKDRAVAQVAHDALIVIIPAHHQT